MSVDLLMPLRQPPEEAKHIAIVGGSGSGKTTLARLMRESCLKQGAQVAFPQRILSRDPRADDMSDENRSVGMKAFDSLARAGMMHLWWERPMVDGALMKYGFLKTDVQGPCVFADNDAFALYPQQMFPNPVVRREVVMVQVVCAQADRVGRLQERSPALMGKVAEWETRTRDDEALVAEVAHYQIANPYGYQEDAAEALMRVLDDVGVSR